MGRPEKLRGPVYRPLAHDFSALTDAAAENRITRTTYDDDPLLRVSSVVPPGHTSSNAVDTRYGTWGSGPARAAPM